ncbi:MAG: ATP-dependent DNA helicase RecG, partial [Eubacteriales bacterium]
MNSERSESSKLATPVGEFRGVGTARAAALARMGIYTAGDLLRCYPRAYQNRGDTLTLAEIREKLKDGNTDTPFSAILTISAEPTVSMIRRGMTLLKARAFDETDAVEITWFNQTYLRETMTTGAMFRFFGKFTLEKSRLKLASPIHEPYAEGKVLPDIVPVYPLSAGLTQKGMTSYVNEALRLCGNEITEFLPPDALEELSLPTLSYTMSNIHHPESMAALDSAKRRLVFDELYLMFLSIALSGAKLRRENTLPMKLSVQDAADFKAVLPFAMTGAQRRSVNEIAADMGGEFLMNRILTGDVGSGKTVVAAAAMYIAVKNGCRAALMAPTEILANQHYADLSVLFGKLGITCALLTGSVKKKERERILSGLSDEDPAAEKIDVIIGTHALISEETDIRRLGLAVIDEQHRFGVTQRAALFEKASDMHCLVMSATPIPRTLTLATYGSIDVSQLDELPAGRQKIDTFIVNEGYRERLNGFIRKQTALGHQVYVVCPAVEEDCAQTYGDGVRTEEMADVPLVENWQDTSLPLKAATVFANELAAALPELTVGCVHGKQKPALREAVMRDFAEGRLNVLVATTVIEVGVNVPNATLMIVENAERFGLSQLHQLRGRVGRGKAKSYFILVSDSKNDTARERLNVIKSTSDGFRIAEYDLEMRGPGDFLSESGIIRQHGQMNFTLAATCRDPVMMERASFYAKRTAASDPELQEEHNRRAAM